MSRAFKAKKRELSQAIAENRMFYGIFDFSGKAEDLFFLKNTKLLKQQKAALCFSGFATTDPAVPCGETDGLTLVAIAESCLNERRRNR